MVSCYQPVIKINGIGNLLNFLPHLGIHGEMQLESGTEIGPKVGSKETDQNLFTPLELQWMKKVTENSTFLMMSSFRSSGAYICVTF